MVAWSTSRHICKSRAINLLMERDAIYFCIPLVLLRHSTILMGDQDD